MFLVRDIFLVEMIHVYPLFSVGCAEELEEIALKLVAVVLDKFLGIFAHEEHLSDVGLGLCVHLEAILVAHLALADLGRTLLVGAQRVEEEDLTWQYHRRRWSPLDLSLLLRYFVDPTSAFGILAAL
jgi:hypothetical protein